MNTGDYGNVDTGDGASGYSAGGGGEWLGALTGFGMQAIGGHQSKKAARKAFERSIYAYQHRYQWAAEDMKAAGLNPILGIPGVGGAPQAPVADVPDYGEGVSRGISSALALKQASLERELLQAQIRKVGYEGSEALTRAAQADQDLEYNEEFRRRERKAELDRQLLTNILLKAGVPGALNEAEMQKAAGPVMKWIQTILKSGKDVSDLVR